MIQAKYYKQDNKEGWNVVDGSKGRGYIYTHTHTHDWSDLAAYIYHYDWFTWMDNNKDYNKL